MHSSPESLDPVTSFVVSRAYAKRLGNLGTQALVEHCASAGNKASDIYSSLLDFSGDVLEETVCNLLENQKNKARGTRYTIPASLQQDEIIEKLSLFVESSIADSMSATLSIPRMRKDEALQIALSPESKAAVRTYAMHDGNDTLIFPHDYMLHPGPFIGSKFLRYDPKIGHLQTSHQASDNGCPISRGKGHLIENIYGAYAEVLIRQVEYLPGIPYYHPNTT